jgi:hypothetical protein
VKWWARRLDLLRLVLGAMRSYDDTMMCCCAAQAVMCCTWWCDAIHWQWCSDDDAVMQCVMKWRSREQGCPARWCAHWSAKISRPEFHTNILLLFLWPVGELQCGVAIHTCNCNTSWLK